MTDSFRTEHDLLGERRVPREALYGIHTVRALENFPIAGRPVHPALIHAFGDVKGACGRINQELGVWKRDEERALAIIAACDEMSAGKLDDHVVVDALQGGAGTSTNMNVNEVIANRALQILGWECGRYDRVSPHDDVNLHQSTNDTYPTALRIAAIRGFRRLEEQVTLLQEAFQNKERQFADVVKVGRTQMQDAVLITLGREMGAYADVLGRDRWRLSKCEERLRVVNLGGTAIGTGIAAPREFIFRVVDRLRASTGLGLARAENLIDATQNCDAFVEVSSLLKTCATNLLKISSDLRFMASGPTGGIAEIRLPPRQAGSSIMPGKVNPVMPEAMTQVALLVIAHDGVIAQAAGMGTLELNPFTPLIAHCMLDSLDFMCHAIGAFRGLCVEGIEANADRCGAFVRSSTAIATALVPAIGYSKSVAVVKKAEQEGRSIVDVAVAEGHLTEEALRLLISPESVTALGSRGLLQRPPAPDR